MRDQFERVLKADCQLGESPVWLADRGVLAFADITARKIHHFDPDSGAHRVDTV